VNKSVLSINDDLPHGLRIRGNERASARHRVQHRPREDERNGQVHMCVAETEHLCEQIRRDRAEEAKAAQVVVVLIENVFAKGAATRKSQVSSLGDRVGAHDDETRGVVLFVDALCGAHEHIESAHRFETPGAVRHDSMRLGQAQALAKSCWIVPA